MQNRHFDMADKVTPPATAKEAKTCSVASEMTGNDLLSGDFVEQEESSIMESQKKESSEWTNEKHSLYLKSIEASFVDQLYNSLDMQSLQRQKHRSLAFISNKKDHAKARIPSGQFKVLQGGFWSKKSFRRENSHPHVSPSNPWIRHFTNGAVAFPSLQERPSTTATSLQYHVSQESDCSNTEVTDQNFVEEDTSIKNTNRKSSRKRTRSCAGGHSTNDQVVPFGTFPATKNSDK